jgi:hypothetical protein
VSEEAQEAAEAKRFVHFGAVPTGRATALRTILPVQPQNLSSTVPPAGKAEQASLSRDFGEFLMELSLSLHKHTIYPPNHPLLAPTVARVANRLSLMLENRPSLSLGIAEQQFVIEGVATDPRHPVLKQLAERLHRHHLGAITFRKGVPLEEIATALQTVSVDASRLERPLGLLPSDKLPSWPHIRLYPITYDRLQLVDEEPARGDREGPERRTHAEELWLGLASAALAAEVQEDNPTLTDPVVIARSIDEHQKSEGYDQVVVGYLLQITHELKSGGGDATVLRRRISRLLTAVRPDTLQRLMYMGGDLQQRSQFVADASHGVAVDALMQIVQAASDSSTHAISGSMMRMLSKLAAHAEAGADPVRPQADSALREQIRDLFTGWKLEDPNPESYNAVLEDLSRRTIGAPAAPQAERAADPAAHAPEPMRLIQMALEAEIVGPGVWEAVDRLLEQREIVTLIGLLESVPAANVTAKEIWARISTADAFGRLIGKDAVESQALNWLVASLGLEAARPMLDKLMDTTSRAERRILIGQLTRLGPEVGSLAIERLADGRWFVQRNILSLLAGLTRWPEGFSPAPYSQHPDARVRREAFKLRLRMPAEREQAMCQALDDEDERILTMALTAAQDGCSEAARGLIEKALSGGRYPAAQRVLAVHALGASRSPSALSALLDLALMPKTWLRPPRLAGKSPELVAALKELGRNWPSDEGAATALGLAAESADAEIRAAVRTEAAAQP